MFYFINRIRPKAFVRTVMASVFIMAMLYFLLEFALWLVPAVVVFIHLLVLILYSGYARIDGSEKGPRLIVCLFGRKEVLNGPFQAQRWWSYQFEFADELNELQKFGSTGNDLYVFLELTSPSGEQLTFVEYIGFDSRFPNECEHEIREIGDSKAFIPVQRADRLASFLERAGVLQF